MLDRYGHGIRRGRQIIGSLAVNFYRLIIGCLLLSVFSLIYCGMPLPTDATLHNWIWLLIPIFIIPPAVIFKKEPIAIRDVLGALIAVSGSALLFLN